MYIFLKKLLLTDQKKKSDSFTNSQDVSKFSVQQKFARLVNFFSYPHKNVLLKITKIFEFKSTRRFLRSNWLLSNSKIQNSTTAEILSNEVDATFHRL